MKRIGIAEAKARLSSLYVDAMNGEIVIISKNNSGEGVRLTPFRGALPPPRGFGMFAEEFKDLPADYWTNPKYDEEAAALFPGGDE